MKLMLKKNRGFCSSNTMPICTRMIKSHRTIEKISVKKNETIMILTQMNIFYTHTKSRRNPNNLNPSTTTQIIYTGKIIIESKSNCKSVRLKKPKQERKPKQDKPDNMNQKKCLTRKRRAPSTPNLTSP